MSTLGIIVGFSTFFGGSFFLMLVDEIVRQHRQQKADEAMQAEALRQYNRHKTIAFLTGQDSVMK